MSNFPHPPRCENSNEKNRKNNPRFKKSQNKISNPKEKRTIISDLYDEADYGADHESLVDEKYKLVIDISNLRKEVKKLHNKIIEKDDEIILLDQEDDYLRRKYESYEREPKNEDLKRCVSTNLVKLENEFALADQELRIITSSFSTFNKRKLLGEIQDQFDEIAGLKRDNYFLLAEYQGILNNLHSPELSSATEQFQQNVYVIDQLHQELEEAQQKELKLSAQIDKIKRRSTISVRKEMQLEKLRKEYLKLSHYRRIRQKEIDAAQERHKQRLCHVSDLKKKQAKIRNENQERQQFQQAMQSKPKRYISRAPNHIKADNIEYLHGFVKKHEKVDTNSSQSKAQSTSSKSKKSRSSSKNSKKDNVSKKSNISEDEPINDEQIEEEEEDKSETNEQTHTENKQSTEIGNLETIQNQLGGTLLDFDNANKERNAVKSSSSSDNEEIHKNDNLSQSGNVTAVETLKSNNEENDHQSENNESTKSEDKDQEHQSEDNESAKSENKDNEQIQLTPEEKKPQSNHELNSSSKISDNNELSGDFEDSESKSSKRSPLTNTISDIVGKLDQDSLSSDNEPNNSTSFKDSNLNLSLDNETGNAISIQNGENAENNDNDIEANTQSNHEEQEKMDNDDKEDLDSHNEKNNQSLRFSDSDDFVSNSKKETQPEEDIDDSLYHGGTSLKPSASTENQEMTQVQNSFTHEDSDNDSDIISRPNTPANKSQSPHSHSDDDF